MLPVIAIVGRPNVGKSTLFNALTRRRDALVADYPGLTRDTLAGAGRLGPCPYVVMDTGGLAGNDADPLAMLVSRQAMLAAKQSDAVVFVVDGRDGLSGLDQEIAGQLRHFGKPVHVAINKAEGFDSAIISAEFQVLGFAHWHTISAAHGEGLREMMEQVLADFPAPPEEQAETVDGARRVKVAMVGRPNVGKSTLINRILGEERQLTYDMPGTTRDSVFIPFERLGKPYTLIDTAGIRRRARVEEMIEKFSVIKALQAIEIADVVVMMLDAREGIADQDAALLGQVLDSGRALVLAVNKWDGLTEDQRQAVRNGLELKLHFLNFARLHFISALHGSGVGNLFESIDRAYASAHCKIPTPRLNDLLERIVEAHPPPVGPVGRRVKLRYIHQGGHNPPLFIIHGRQTDALPDSYKRYLINALRDALELEGTPLRVEFRQGENPFEGKKNTLTARQVRKKRRLIRHVKK
jgi:GTP-binding protein